MKKRTDLINQFAFQDHNTGKLEVALSSVQLPSFITKPQSGPTEPVFPGMFLGNCIAKIFLNDSDVQPGLETNHVKLLSL